MFVRQLSLLLALAVVSSPGASADVRSRRDADAMKQKIDAINHYAEQPGKQPRRTTVTENELNAYLALEVKPQLPAGVLDPAVSILGTGRVTGRAIVDLDAVRNSRKTTGGLLDPMTYLTGRL